MTIKQVRYDIGEEIFETTVRDTSGAKLENWRVNKGDFLEVVSLLKRKYGLRRNDIDKKPKDLNWLN